MKNYSKIFKWIMLALIVISVVVTVVGFIAGFETNDGAAVNALLYWTYAMIAIAAVCIVVVGIIIRAQVDKKSIIKMGIILLAMLVLCGIVYLVSPANPAVGMLEQPSESTLKITTFILNLTYIFGAGAILSIIVGAIHDRRLNK